MRFGQKQMNSSRSWDSFILSSNKNSYYLVVPCGRGYPLLYQIVTNNSGALMIGKISPVLQMKKLRVREIP